MTQSTPSNEPSSSSYTRAMAAASREARWGFLFSIAIALFFWGAIFLLEGADRVAGLPLWFWWAMLGGYLLSLVAVWGFNRLHASDPDFDRAVEALKKEAQ